MATKLKLRDYEIVGEVKPLTPSRIDKLLEQCKKFEIKRYGEVRSEGLKARK